MANLSASNGHKSAAELRDTMTEEMTPADISKAQDMAQAKAAEIKTNNAAKAAELAAAKK
ncbi:MAG: hypothetical protein HQL31_13230 [Planctomycetes bacterium]|nr:hypothetical protein [Planctomycetota bacterium]